MNIIDYETHKFVFSSGSYTLTEAIQSREWMDYLKDVNGPQPTSAVVLFLCRLCERQNMVVNTDTYYEILEGVEQTEAYGKRVLQIFNDWKEHEAPGELERATIMIDFIRRPLRSVNPFMFEPFFGEKYTNVQKGRQLHRLYAKCTMIDRHILFMLAFKYSKPSKSEKKKDIIRPISSIKFDKNYTVYEQATSALWDYINTFDESISVEMCSDRRGYTMPTLMREWVKWVYQQGEKYADFLAYKGKTERKKRDNARTTVFGSFLWEYIKAKAGGAIGRGDMRTTSATRVKIRKVDEDRSTLKSRRGFQ